jgi:hypothetical protein
MTTITIGRELLEQALGQLICNTNNMQKGMSKSIQKLCARENAEVLERLRTALAAPATAPDELERLRQIAHLTGTIFCYGNFVAETHNEAVLEKLLRENGTFWDSVEQYEKSQGWIP